MSYNPAIGRFLQRDPIGYDDGMNPYEYGHSNPLGYVDPAGMQARPTVNGNPGPATRPSTWPSTRPTVPAAGTQPLTPRAARVAVIIELCPRVSFRQNDDAKWEEAKVGGRLDEETGWVRIGPKGSVKIRMSDGTEAVFDRLGSQRIKTPATTLPTTLPTTYPRTKYKIEGAGPEIEGEDQGPTPRPHSIRG